MEAEIKKIKGDKGASHYFLILKEIFFKCKMKNKYQDFNAEDLVFIMDYINDIFRCNFLKDVIHCIIALNLLVPINY